MAMAAACASNDLSSRPPELVVEGNEEAYPAFEGAAQACRYTAFRRYSGTGTGKMRVGPHLNLYRIESRAARCAIRWMRDHPEVGLIVMVH
jgi:hypothetical protein